jgi:hypothetical protein
MEAAMSELRTLWRATDADGQLGALTWWAENDDDARAYLDNPGYGGDTLHTMTADVQYTLDLTADMPHYARDDSAMIADLAEALEDETIVDRYHGAYIHDVLEDEEITTALAQMYDWVRIYDTYPEGAATWLRLT